MHIVIAHPIPGTSFATLLAASFLLVSPASGLPPGHDTCSTPDVLSESVVAGPFTTVEANDDHAPGCVVLDGPDTVHEFTLAMDSATLVIATPQSPEWDLITALRASESCAVDTDLSCVAVAGGLEQRFINEPRLAAGTYDVIVDGASGASGSYTIEYRTGAYDPSFGYWKIESVETFETISDDGSAIQIAIPVSTAANSQLGAEWSRALTLPFGFDFYGTSYSAVNANSNMFLTFSTPPTGSQAYLNDCLDDTEPHNVIAAFWDDGISHEDGPSSLWTKVEGVAPNRRFIIEYVNWWSIGPAPNYYLLDVDVNHQVILYESGDIELRYGPRSAPSIDVGCHDQHTGCSATIGIEGGTAASHDADVVDCELENTVDGRVIYFVHPSAASPVSPPEVPSLPGAAARLALLAILLMLGSVLLVRRSALRVAK